MKRRNPWIFFPKKNKNKRGCGDRKRKRAKRKNEKTKHLEFGTLFFRINEIFGLD